MQKLLDPHPKPYLDSTCGQKTDPFKELYIETMTRNPKNPNSTCTLGLGFK